MIVKLQLLELSSTYDSKPLLDRCAAPVTKVLADQMMRIADVDDVVLVGGATRMPQIRRMLENMFSPERLNFDLNPDVTIAYGAANIED